MLRRPEQSTDAIPAGGGTERTLSAVLHRMTKVDSRGGPTLRRPGALEAPARKACVEVTPPSTKTRREFLIQTRHDALGVPRRNIEAVLGKKKRTSN